MSDFDNPAIFRAILEAMPTGVYVVDQNRRILFWNAGAESISGYLSQDVVGRFLREHLLSTGDETKSANSAADDPVDMAFRDGKSSTAGVSLLHKQGYRLPIVLHTVPIRNERGAIIGVAECFEQLISASDRTRRQKETPNMECLDAVIGIPARTTMESTLRERLTLFAEQHAYFAILVIEVDQLEHYSANCGPAVVPNILRVVAQTIENSLRPTDIVGCWTRNSFLALLLGCKESDIQSVANRIRQMIGQSEVEWWGDRFAVTAALGGAGCRPEDTVELLTTRAGKSLAQSISDGGNRVTVVV